MKPLSLTNRSVAVLLLNNQDIDVANVSVTVELEGMLGMGPAVKASVFDVWEGRVVHPNVSSSFTTDAFGGHDSRFYVVTPLIAPSTSRAAVIVSPSCEKRCATYGAAGRER